MSFCAHGRQGEDRFLPIKPLGFFSPTPPAALLLLRRLLALLPLHPFMQIDHFLLELVPLALYLGALEFLLQQFGLGVEQSSVLDR